MLAEDNERRLRWLRARCVRRAQSGYGGSRRESQGRRVNVTDKSSRQDKNEGAMDKAKGRMKEAGGALTGDKDKKAEGQADQDKGTLKEKKGAAKDLLK